MQQTALQELISEWEQKKRTSSNIYLPIIQSFIDSLKSKLSTEKEQIIWSFEYGTGMEIFHEDAGLKFYNDEFEQ